MHSSDESRVRDKLLLKAPSNKSLHPSSDVRRHDLGNNKIHMSWYRTIE
jgi:hypothetical protein